VHLKSPLTSIFKLTKFLFFSSSIDRRRLFSGVIYVSFSINKADEMRERGRKKRRERMVRKKIRGGEGEKSIYCNKKHCK